MDERCPNMAQHDWDARTGRCKDCGHAIAVHGYDSVCDLCSLERKLRRK